RQREAVDGFTGHDRQQFLVGQKDAVVAPGRDWENAATEGVAAGVFEQRRINAAADDLLVRLQGLLLGDDVRLLQLAPVGGVDLLDEFGRRQAREVGGQRRGVAARGEARRRRGARLAEEHGEVAGAGAGRQRVLEGAFEAAVVRVAEDVI